VVEELAFFHLVFLSKLSLTYTISKDLDLKKKCWSISVNETGKRVDCSLWLTKTLM